VRLLCRLVVSSLQQWHELCHRCRPTRQMLQHCGQRYLFHILILIFIFITTTTTTISTIRCNWHVSSASTYGHTDRRRNDWLGVHRVDG
jgi:hypothetical protein